MTSSEPPRYYWLLLFCIPVGIVSLLLWAFVLIRPRFTDADSRASIENGQYRALALQVGGLYDTVPDHRVGRILQRGVTKPEAGTEVRSNNAGMRSNFDYAPKTDDGFRIVFLGDSFTYGFGGAVDDRFSNLIALQLKGQQVNEREVEVINLSIGSWTAVNEAQYLSSRISEYQPDLIVVLLVSNDISDTQGVRGIGAISNEFSPEHRHRGSGVFHNAWPRAFGVNSINLLGFDLSQESRKRWQDLAEALTRLDQLQRQIGGKLLLTVLNENDYFNALVHHHLAAAGFQSPLALVDYGAEMVDHRLAHDPHPSRLGHQRLADQITGHLNELGWISLARAPILNRPALWTAPEAVQPQLANLRIQVSEDYLVPSIDFESMSKRDPVMFLGGVLPDLDVANPLEAAPYAAPYAAWVLARDSEARELRLTIELPARVELYPLTLSMFLDGNLATQRTYSYSQVVRRVALHGAIPLSSDFAHSIEVRLVSSQHFSGIEDHRTRSVKLLRVEQI